MFSLKQFLLLLFICFSVPSISQFSLGGEVGYLHTLRQTNLHNVGVGVNWQLSYHDRLAFSVRANYYLGSKYSYYTIAEAKDSITAPQEIEIDVMSTVSYLHIYLGSRFYYFGGYEKDFGTYILGNVGLLRAPISVELGEYDDKNYISLIEDGSNSILHNFTFSPGIGIEKKFNFGYMYMDTKVNFVLKKYSGEFAHYDIPTTLGVNLGIRYRL